MAFPALSHGRIPVNPRTMYFLLPSIATTVAVPVQISLAEAESRDPPGMHCVHEGI
jgi:hypothetical protein